MKFTYIHIERKDGGNIRITQDFKKLNVVTIKDAYPIKLTKANKQNGLSPIYLFTYMYFF